MKRKLFCELNPLTYYISVGKERFKRWLIDFISKNKFSKTKSEKLPVIISNHSSLIRRKLGNVNLELQENKAINLSIAAPKVNGVIIKPGEVFSFWKLVGSTSKAKGYKEGLTISSGKISQGIGGGLCQFTNLIHWMILHSPLEIIEHHHHDGIDMFPDYGRQVPFGCGTSIFFNYVDYRFINNTNQCFQLITYTTDTHLCGELRAMNPLSYKYHVEEENSHFVKLEDAHYRRNSIYRKVIDKTSGHTIAKELIKESNARVLYDEEFIDKSMIRII